ncbi:MAG TPA: nuclear pore complex subunit [Cytophagales bacterium]|nr:nuclear pore complex subunit [Cytophagales bacterium]
MSPLEIAETADTPGIVLDKGLGKFQFSGRSLNDNVSAFYQPVIAWFKEYAKSPNSETDLHFKFEYLNVESSKEVLNILTVMESVKGARVSWYFNEDDEDMEEIGDEISELVNIPFEFKIYS